MFLRIGRGGSDGRSSVRGELSGSYRRPETSGPYRGFVGFFALPRRDGPREVTNLLPLEKICIEQFLVPRPRTDLGSP